MMAAFNTPAPPECGSEIAASIAYRITPFADRTIRAFLWYSDLRLRSDVTRVTNNLIEWNDIFDIGQGMLSDMGGIYTLGKSSGTVLRNNRISNVIARALWRLVGRVPGMRVAATSW